MSEITAIMSRERLTKRKIRFQETDRAGNTLPYSEQSIGTLYLPHEMFETRPERIKVTISTEVLE